MSPTDPFLLLQARLIAREVVRAWADRIGYPGPRTDLDSIERALVEFRVTERIASEVADSRRHALLAWVRS